MQYHKPDGTNVEDNGYTFYCFLYVILMKKTTYQIFIDVYGSYEGSTVVFGLKAVL